MASVDALPDLPMAWLHYLSTKLTAESAARLRSTCKLLQQVVDATWEPVEVEVPPHRRSVPLTFEQVQAQLPPQQPQSRGKWYMWEDFYDDEDYYDRYEWREQGGCNPYWREMFGPALTRLTANQAVNTLKGKAVICWLNEGQSMLSRDSTAADKMDELHELQFPGELRDCYGEVVQWPPPVKMCDADSECECECQGSPEKAFGPGRGEGGWGGGYEDYNFCINYVTPGSEPLHASDGQLPGYIPRPYLGVHQEPNRVYVSTCPDKNSLLVTTSRSCRQATAAEVQTFVWSTAASGGSRFDVYLSHASGDYRRTYVFLDPCELRMTGRVKPYRAWPITAEAPGAGAATSAQAGQAGVMSSAVDMLAVELSAL